MNLHSHLFSFVHFLYYSSSLAINHSLILVYVLPILYVSWITNYKASSWILDNWTLLSLLNCKYLLVVHTSNQVSPSRLPAHQQNPQQTIYHWKLDNHHWCWFHPCPSNNHNKSNWAISKCLYTARPSICWNGIRSDVFQLGIVSDHWTVHSCANDIMLTDGLIIHSSILTNGWLMYNVMDTT